MFVKNGETLLWKTSLDIGSKLLLHTYLHTVRSNHNCWKTILWSKIEVLWAPINHLKSATTHLNERFRRKRDLSNKILSFFSRKGCKSAKCQSLRSEKIKFLAWVACRFQNVALNSKFQIVWFKSQTLTPSSFAAL